MTGKLLLHFRVEGVKPTTKGSLSNQGHRMVENVDPEGIFRTAVARAAWTAATGQFNAATHYRHVAKVPEILHLGPVETRMRFWLPAPARAQWWAPAQGRSGDIEKLVRNVHDAISVDAGVIEDDAQITTLGRVAKRFAEPDVLIEPGVDFWMFTDERESALEEDERWFA